MDHIKQVTVASSATVFFSGLTFNNGVALTGLLLGAASFVLDWYYKRKRRLYEKEMLRIQTSEKQGS